MACARMMREPMVEELTELRPVAGTEVRDVAAVARPRLHRGRTWMLAAGDSVALVAAYALSYAIAASIAPLPPVSAAPWFLALVAATAPLVWAGVFTAYHLYENDNLKISVSSFDEVRDLFHAMLAGSLGYLIVSQARAGRVRLVDLRTGRGRALPLGRARAVPVVRGSIRSWVFPRIMQPRRTLIVGSGDDAQLVYRKLKAHPEYGLEVVGFLDGDAEQPPPGPVLGSPDDDRATSSTSYEIDRVLLASSVGATRRRWISCAPCGGPTSRSRSSRATSRSSPRTRSSTTSRACPSSRCRRCASDGARALLKRSVDMVVSATALLVLSPAARADRARDPARQPGAGALPAAAARAGLARRSSIVKFRTMFIGAEQRRARSCT